MPETSKLGEQMEEVGKEATESFGKGSTGLGDKIHESVTKSRDKIKDVFHRTGSDAGKSMSDAFKEESKAVEDTAGDVGKKAEGKFRESTKGWGKVLVEAVGPETKKLLGDRLEDVVGGALSGVLGDNAKIGGQLARTVAEGAFDALTHKLGDVKVAAANTRQAFADFGKGDTTAGVTKLVDGMGKLGIETKDLPQPLQDVIGKTAELKGTAQGFADVFKDLPGQIGRIGTALGELAGPLGALGATMLALKDQEKAGLLDKTDASGHEDWWKLAGGVGGSWLEDKYNRLFHGHGTPGAGPSGVDMSGTGGIGRGGDVLGSSQDAYDAFTSGSGFDWDKVAKPESGGNWANADTGHNGHYGGLQFSPSTWAEFGGLEFAPRPDLATPEQQKIVADRTAFSGYKGQKPQGLGAWETITNGSVPGVTASSSPASSFASSGGMSASSGQLPATPPDENSVRSWVEQNFGIKNTFGTGSWENATHSYDGKLHHPGGAKEGPAFDFHGTTAQMDALANWVADNYKDKTLELIHQGPGFDHNREIKNAKFGDVYGADLNAAHAGHVHWAMTQAPNGMARGTTAGGDKIPTGAQHDPLFVSAAGSAGGAGGAAGDGSNPLAQQLGSGLLGGVAQSVGLDGSVFKTFSGASNPMDFGITKLGTGLMNWAGGMLPAMQGQHTPKQQPASPTYNVDQSFNITQHGVEGNGETPFKAAMNSSNRTAALAANMPGG
jgi:hypothetical protein